MEVLMRNAEDDWKFVSDTEGLIIKWEAKTKIKLPEDYRSFLTKYNGGRIYPCLFKHNVPQELWKMDDDVVIFNPAYDWLYVLQRMEENFNFSRFPENSIPIGSDPGGLEVVMSLEENSFGKIYVIHFGVGPEDDEPMMRAFLQANSFREFIFDELIENDDRDGYDYWFRRNKDHLTRKVEF